jgi:hypothetical protein
MHVITTRWSWNRWVAAGTTVLLGTLGWSNAQADAATDWHEIAATTLCKTTPPLRPGPHGFLDLAVVQAAVYDAVQNIGGKYKPYHVTIPGASGSPEVAAATAAHDVLVKLYPTQAEKLGATYKEYLSKKGLKEDDPGAAVGQKAAAGIVAFRADDGRHQNPPPPFVGEKVIGIWRTTPPQTGYFAQMASPWLGEAKPFAVQSNTQFRAKQPPALTSEEYTKDYNEVKAVGAKTGGTRTPEQTEIADFFDSNHLCLTFQRAPHNVVANAVAANTKSLDESSRVLMLVTMSISDALIICWNDKRHFNTWRPVTAINEGENDGNPATAGDPAWQPYLTTPPYSDYTSGANANMAAIARTLINVFGKDDMTFTITSESPTATQKTRTYNKFSDMAADMVNARIYQGIHFRFADTAGRELGEKVADYVFKNVATAK